MTAFQALSDMLPLTRGKYVRQKHVYEHFSGHKLLKFHTQLRWARKVLYSRGIDINSQGRRRLFESGTAIEQLRFSPNAEGTSGGRRWEADSPLIRGGFGGPPPRKFCNSRWLKKRFCCTLRPFLIVKLSLFYRHYSYILNAYHSLFRL